MRQDSFRFWIFLLFAGMVMMPGIVLGQPGKGLIRGVVMDDSLHQPMPYVSVVLYKLPDSAFISGSVTDANGEFLFRNFKAEPCFLRVSFVGYRTMQLSVPLEGGVPARTDTIRMKRTLQYLEAVTVSSKVADKVVQFDKTRIQVDQAGGAATGSITEVLKGSSDVIVSPDLKVFIRGNSNVLILLDGRPVSSDLLALIPASSVESVEIITNPNVKYDAEGTGGIINIVTRAESRKGWSGALNHNTTTLYLDEVIPAVHIEPWNVNVPILSRFNTGGQLIYRGKKGFIQASGSLKVDFDKVSGSLTRSIHTETPVIIQQKSISRPLSLIPTAGIQFQLKTRPGETWFGSLRHLSPSQYTTQLLEITKVDGITGIEKITVNNEIGFYRKIWEISQGYRFVKVPGRRELVLEGTFSHTKGSRPASYRFENDWARSSGGGTPTLASLQADYLRKIPLLGLVETGAKISRRWNSFSYLYYEKAFQETMWTLNYAFSNDLTHNESVLAGYLMYSDTLPGGIFCKAGLRAEYESSYLLQKNLHDTVTRNDWYPFPFLMLRYQKNPRHQFSAGYNRRITRPTYPQLNPWISVVDPATFETGNKNLLPELAGKWEAMYRYAGNNLTLTSTLYHSTTRNYITQITMLDDISKLRITWVNAEVEQKTGLEATCRLPLVKWFVIEGGGSLWHLNTKGFAGGMDLAAEGVAWNARMNLVVNPIPGSRIQLNGYYASDVPLPLYHLKEMGWIDFSISHAMLKNRLTVNVLVSDLLKTRRWRISAENAVYTLKNKSDSRTRYLWIGLVWNINSFKAAPAKTPQDPDPDRTLIKVVQ